MACVYQIRNLVNDKFYIGSTHKPLQRRIHEHLTKLRANYHNNKHLQSAWNKYGEENFIFETVEDITLPEDYSNDRKYELITSKEMHYITTMNPEYNIAREIRAGKLGRSPSKEEREHLRKLFTGRKVSDEARKKIREARAKQVITEETKRKIGEKSKGNKYCLGHKQSEEQKQKARESALKNIKNGVGFHSIESQEKRTKTLKIVFNTPEMKEKLKATARNRNRKLFVCIKDGVIINQFSTKIEAAEALGIKSLGISAVLTGEQKTHRGYRFEYINNN
jgi:group I intron endonuclease